jgi:hypothetical protein
MEQDFGVALTAERKPFLLQFDAKFPVVVDLSVEDQSNAIIRADHRLVPER